jgi:hypothetical protein
MGMDGEEEEEEEERRSDSKSWLVMPEGGGLIWEGFRELLRTGWLASWPSPSSQICLGARPFEGQHFDGGLEPNEMEVRRYGNGDTQG